MRKIIISVIITAIVFGGAGYFLGTKSGSAKAQIPQGFGGRGNRMGNPAFGGASGQIIAKDATSITVQMNAVGGNSGGSKIVFFSASTPVLKSVAGTAADLSIGEQITANGTANPDGSITAQTIQIRPAQK